MKNKKEDEIPEDEEINVDLNEYFYYVKVLLIIRQYRYLNII